ncbi:7-cyano-7-deazaguanine synthase [Xenorhabdus sp. PR6a]|uniref:7-cyano-7-deazaguanine synthase n=1 Tax=Xenorhabdus sp. PR6a TaxID=3025877 RepID=UPI002359FEC7|nr:7-cyano-7-deazaguanine synthase [Xenorhabdus sp. PR6a]MDC9581146.1 7-cyano-7-deazaguanine synthase [Xenorhabdus sp. PR6a]
MKFSIRVSDDWSNYEDENIIVYIKGQGYIKENIYSNNEIIKEIVNESNIEKTITSLNGFFSIILIDKNKKNIFLISDHIRSIPLFYTKKQGLTIISDIAEEIREVLNLKEFNKSNETEMMLNSFISGDETLFDDIKQLEAGSIVKIHNDNYTIKKEYYNKNNVINYLYDDYAFLKEHEKILLTSIQRLAKFANGRKIVIPLSAGYDSKIIATLLKKINYKNIISFSYGKKKYHEVKKSEEIAKKLNIKWVFVDYSKIGFKEKMNSDNAKDYMIYSCNYCSLPHTQDFLAVKFLKENKIIPDDSIFVPGHSIASSFPYITEKTEIIKTPEEIAKNIYSFYFNCDPKLKQKNKAILLEKIKFLIKDKSDDKTYLSDFILYWGSYEDDVKYIVNSIKVYEFFGYDFWLPLWDKEYSHFWTNTENKFKYHRTWYEKFIDEQFNALLENRETNIFLLSDLPKKNKTRSILKKISYLKNIKNAFSFIFSKDNLLCMSYIYSKKEIFLLYMQGKHFRLKYTKELINHLINHQKNKRM